MRKDGWFLAATKAATGNSSTSPNVASLSKPIEKENELRRVTPL
jgi:hypothetical protein